MNQLILKIAICTTLLVLAGQSPARPTYGEFYRSIKSTQAQNWDKSLLTIPIEQKIKPMDDRALEFNQAMNNWEQYKSTPTPAELDKSTYQDLIAELHALPRPILNFANKHVIAIYTGRNIGGTAMACSIYGSGDTAEFGFILIDLDMVDRTINEWATFKENTVFAPTKDYELRLTLEDDAHNTKAATLRYILLHEIGHLFHSVNGLQPGYPSLTWEESNFTPYSFNQTELAIKKKRGDDYYPLYDKIRFYRTKAPFELEDAPDVYHWLLTTSFPTLYASVNHLEDFAETFALIAHTHYLKKSFKLVLIQGKKEILRIDNRIADANMAPKVTLVEEYLKRY